MSNHRRNDTQTCRKTDRKIDRQTDRQTHTDRQTDRQQWSHNSTWQMNLITTVSRIFRKSASAGGMLAELQCGALRYVAFQNLYVRWKPRFTCDSCGPNRSVPLLCTQANSASYHQRDEKWVLATATGWRHSVAHWGDGVSASCNVGTNCPLWRAMDGHIMRCGTINWLVPVSCRDCKALLVTSLTHVSGAIASVQTFTFTFIVYLSHQSIAYKLV